MNRKILCVDDEPELMEILKEAVQGRYDIDIVTSGAEGVERISSAQPEPYDLALSDFRMPKMNGVEFLMAVKNESPTTTRMLVTGFPEEPLAQDAKKAGVADALLAKSDGVAALMSIIDEKLSEREIVDLNGNAEASAAKANKQEPEDGKMPRELREPMEQTALALLEMLKRLNPIAYSQTARISAYARQLGSKIDYKDPWTLNIASQLALIGCCAVPTHLLERKYAGDTLSPREERVIDTHPAAGQSIIEQIHLLGKAARMIGAHNQHQDENKLESRVPEAVGAAIIKVASDYNAELSRGVEPKEAIETLKKNSAAHPPFLMEKLVEIPPIPAEKVRVEILVENLSPGMKLGEDIVTHDGVPVLLKNQTINEIYIERIQNFLFEDAIPDSIIVEIER